MAQHADWVTVDAAWHAMKDVPEHLRDKVLNLMPGSAKVWDAKDGRHLYDLRQVAKAHEVLKAEDMRRAIEAARAEDPAEALQRPCRGPAGGCRMNCQTHGCPHDAVCAVAWPGSATLAMCAFCRDRAFNVADSMGFELTVLPIEAAEAPLAEAVPQGLRRDYGPIAEASGDSLTRWAWDCGLARAPGESDTSLAKRIRIVLKDGSRT